MRIFTHRRGARRDLRRMVSSALLLCALCASACKYCSVVVAGDRLLILDTKGLLTLVKADASGYQGRTKVSDGQTWSHLALVGSRIYVRNRQQLVCLDLLGKAAN